MDLELELEPEALEMLPVEEGLTGHGPPVFCEILSMIYLGDRPS